MFNDILFSPLHISDISKSIIKVIKNPIKGTYNLGSRDSISKASFGLKFAERLSLSTKFITIGSFEKGTLKAKRPKDMSMDINHFERTFQQRLATIDDSINKICADYR